MVNIAFPRENIEFENRCSLLPQNVAAYKRLGMEVLVESGLGKGVYISDTDYEQAGATVLHTKKQVISGADIVVTLHKLNHEQVKNVQPGALVISFLDPFNEFDLIDTFCHQQITSISVEMLPRISRCQKMDALSSQASLAGYVMVQKGMQYLQSVMPMMMTPAGTLKPMKVFVIGAGVAGLQAIATAKRLGAQVTAFDTRAVVAEQVQSLGAKFLEIDLGETAQTAQGYATALTPEQMAIQQREQAKCIASSDLVITTAQLFGRKPPVLIKRDVICQMKPGSVIVDMAAENGGNVEGAVARDVVNVEGVTIVGTGFWANDVARDASQMYSSNIISLVSECWDIETQTLPIELQDEILKAAVITHKGVIVNQTIADFYEQQGKVQLVTTEKPQYDTGAVSQANSATSTLTNNSNEVA
ncbi:NAD(P) transhydrogenase subunit alpha [Psychrosphaera sp. 1_MG-2023]|uniref:NAD(P) transhydrogenase subunit alpha n=1 Tax=Psychrosphaera sp. 1_MG-2023 TaxID=3062643 RepID=UPI0026E1392C|nr:NAD(P) transhydrogenase subunit alpha [Psychrosphaera sp. 1_MG-2023]MDO6719150.1 NAD(P) transhydrogenase subunit alpha [Psychrosphaera sp. 1_MG-2023]